MTFFLEIFSACSSITCHNNRLGEIGQMYEGNNDPQMIFVAFDRVKYIE